jgi:hypothetical protein
VVNGELLVENCFYFNVNLYSQKLSTHHSPLTTNSVF